MSAALIYEAIIITRSADGHDHITPLGYRHEDNHVLLAPFRPSTTLNNLQATGVATINMTDDVSIIAGCLTGRRDWALTPASGLKVARLRDALAHLECAVDRVEADAQRPRFYCRVVQQQNHAPFKGYNRAQAAVLEAAILVSRLHMLPAEKVHNDINYLQIAIDKTAGERERLAWSWLMEAVQNRNGG